jgi:hypothetical protein
MGYTHYFRRKETLPKEEYKQFIDEVKAILKALPKDIKIKGWDGTGKPTITDELLSFNGDDSLGLSHETFSFPRVKEIKEWEREDGGGMYFEFCKTARKPYDVFVCAVLLSASHYFDDKIIISSDGDFSNEEWGEGLELYEKVTGRPQRKGFLENEDF